MLRRFRRPALALAVAFMSLGAAAAPAPTTRPATQPSTRPTAADVDPLVVQLNDDDWKVRQRAQDRIVELGEEAVPLLQEALDKAKEEEVRTRLQAALGQIAANSSSGPTLVTLHLKDAQPQTVFQEISRQAGIEVGAYNDYVWRQVNKKVTIDVDRQPFWQVVQLACEQTGLSPQNYGGRGGRITLGQGNPWGKLPSSSHGPFFVTAVSATRNHNVDYAQDRVSDSFNLRLVAYIDPKVRVLRGSSTVKIEEAVDEKGNDLSPGPAGGGPMGHMQSSGWNGRTWMWDLNVPLKYAPDNGKVLKSFRGSTRFLVQQKSDKWEIADVLNAKDVQRQMPLGKYTVKGITKNNNNYQLKFVIEHGKNLSPHEHPLTDYSTVTSMIRLVDAAGRAWDNSGGGGGGGNGRLEYEIHFYNHGNDGVKAGEPVKLVWEVPTDIKELAVPIEFKDLKIP